jgi:MobC-like protein
MAENEKPIKAEKVAKQNRHIKFEFRLTEEELERLKTQSESHASISEYIRKQCLEMEETPNKMGNQSLKDTLKVLREMNKQLQKIGVNLNQTSKHLNFLVLHNVIDKNMGGRLGHNYTQVERLLWLTDRSLRELIKKF